MLGMDGRTVLKNVGHDRVRVTSDRITPGPTPVGEAAVLVAEDKSKTSKSKTSINE